MPKTSDRSEVPAAIQTHITAIFVSLELSRKVWLVTSLSPGAGEKMSKHCVPAGDVAALLLRFAELKRKAQARTGDSFPIVTIEEAGLDGFWLHRLLEGEGVESHVVDPASIAAPRRRRNAKTDRLDGEALLRALLAFKRGEPRVCAMAVPPTPEEEDRRRLKPRAYHAGRRAGRTRQPHQGTPVLAGDLRLRTDRARPPQAARRTAHRRRTFHSHPFQVSDRAGTRPAGTAHRPDQSGGGGARQTSRRTAGGRDPVARHLLLRLKSIGPEFANVLWSEGLYRHFDNRRQVASYAGLAPTPWQSGSVSHEQGVSKAGNPRLRSALIELAWLWLQNQPQSALSLWFKRRIADGRGKKTTIVALARKLLVALWKYIAFGVVIDGTVMKNA
jgi:transposase